MSDISQGEGWWQASDHKWYPPEQHPDYPPPAPEPLSGAIVPSGDTLTPENVQHGGGAGNGNGNGKWVALAAAAAVIVAIAAFFLLTGGDSKKKVATASTSSSSSSSSTRSSSSSSTASSSSELSAIELQSRMLIPADIGPGFKPGMFQVDSTSPTPCGQQNLNIEVPPKSDLGTQATDATTKAFFREELSVYDDEATAAHAFDVGKQGLSCSQGTTSNGTQFTFSPPRDVSADLGVPNSFVIDYEVGTVTGQLFGVQQGTHIVAFQFEAPSTVDRSTLPDAVAVAKKGLAKLAG